MRSGSGLAVTTAGKPENLKPWQPGQSGNPAGSSRKARMRAYLRDTIPEALAEALTPEELEAIGWEGEAILVADGAAVRLRKAIVSGTHAELMDALRLAVSVEPKQYEVAVTDDPERSELADTLTALSVRRRTNGSGRSPDATSAEDAGS